MYCVLFVVYACDVTSEAKGKRRKKRDKETSRNGKMESERKTRG